MSIAEISKITGLSIRSLKYSRKKLLARKDISLAGYGRIKVSPFSRYKLSPDSAKNAPIDIEQGAGFAPIKHDKVQDLHQDGANNAPDGAKNSTFSPPHVDIDSRQQQSPAAVLNPSPQKAPPSLPALVELHIKVSGAQPNEGLRRSVVNHLNDCHISGWRLADLEKVIESNRLNAVKKNIYDLVKPLSELDLAKKNTQDKVEHLKDLQRRGITCGNCALWDKDRARACAGDYAFWYQICKHEDKFERKT